MITWEIVPNSISKDILRWTLIWETIHRKGVKEKRVQAVGIKSGVFKETDVLTEEVENY